MQEGIAILRHIALLSTNMKETELCFISRHVRKNIERFLHVHQISLILKEKFPKVNNIYVRQPRRNDRRGLPDASVRESLFCREPARMY